MHPGIHAKSNPDKAAYIMAATGKVITYRELDDESNRAANLLRSLGLKPGDTIALFAENHHRYHQVLWAAQRSGLYYTAISSRLTAEEVAYRMRLARNRRLRLPTRPKAPRCSTRRALPASPRAWKHGLTQQPLGAPNPLGMLQAGLCQASPEMIYHPTGKLYKRLTKDRYWVGHSKRIAE